MQSHLVLLGQSTPLTQGVTRQSSESSRSEKAGLIRHKQANYDRRDEEHKTLNSWVSILNRRLPNS